jgi:MFS transporter, DHA1 family, multidrug resistance protein
MAAGPGVSVTGEKAVQREARREQGPYLFRILIYGLVLTSSAGQFAIMPIMPTYAHRFGLSGIQQGAVLAAMGLAAFAVSVPAGILSDRFGARRLTLWSGLIMAIALFGQSLAADFPALLGSRLVFGIGYGVVWTAGLSWIAQTVPSARGLGGSVASAGLGGIAGPAAAGALVQYLGLATPWLVIGTVFAVLTIALSLLRMPAREQAETKPLTARLRTVTANRNTICAAAAIVAAGITSGVCVVLIPARLHAAGASPGQIGFDFAMAGLLFAAVSAVTATAGRRAVSIPVICAGMLTLVAAMAPAAITTAPLAMVATLCAATAIRSVLWSISYPLAVEGALQSSAGVGVVVGLLNGIWAAMAVLAPLTAGLATEHLPAPTIFGLTAAICAAILTATAAIAWRTRQALQPGQARYRDLRASPGSS